jgi:multiple sugar transport system ATP-binding protein
MNKQDQTSSQLLIRLCGLRKEFNGFVAVEGLDLEIKEGEFICFLGPSGCGKTTTLRMIAGLETPTAGDIFLRGVRINDLPPQQRNIGFVFQNYALFWHMTVYDNLAFGLRIRGMPKGQVDKAVREMAKRLELEPFLKTKASRLDLSTMQGVALGRTLLTDPQVLLLDEPLNNIRPGLREVMRAELKRLQRQLGRTMIYVTHDQEEAMTLGDRILVMNAGRVEQFDTPRQIYLHPRTIFVAGFIGRPAMNFLKAEYQEKGGHAFIKWGEFRWDIGPSKEVEVKDNKITLGIRPEHILFAEEAKRRGLSSQVLPAHVDLVQLLGPKKIVDLKINDHIIKMVTSSEHPIIKGDNVKVVFDPYKLHFFAQEDGRMVL